jgi:hypothetical protein
MKFKVRTSRKKGKKRKLARDYINAVLRTALKRKKRGKLATRHMNAMLRTALKRKTRDALHKCYASHRIKNVT